MDLRKQIAALTRTKGNVELLKDRQKWKEEFEANLNRRKGNRTYGDAIIRDVARMDVYPEHDEDDSEGISSWFKVEIKGLYHRGVEVILRVISIKYDEEKSRWRFCKYDEQDAVNGILVGRIPFDGIRNVEWSGDQYYYNPHIYCNFSQKNNQPYEELLFYKAEGTGEHEYYVEVAKYDEVQ